MITINVNDLVRVKLTNEGRAILRHRKKIMTIKYYDLSGLFDLPEEDSNGWSEWKLRDLMVTFNDSILSSFSIPFETEIQVDLDKK